MWLKMWWVNVNRNCKKKNSEEAFNNQTNLLLLVLFHKWMSLLSLWVARQILNDPLSQILEEEFLLWVDLFYMTWNFPYKFKVIAGLWPKISVGIPGLNVTVAVDMVPQGAEGRNWSGAAYVGARECLSEWTGPSGRKDATLVLCLLPSQSLYPLWSPPKCLLLTPTSLPFSQVWYFQVPGCRPSDHSPPGLCVARWGV